MNLRSMSSALVTLGLLLASQQMVLAQKYYTGFDYLFLDRSESSDASRNLIYSDNNASQDVPIQPITRPQGVALSTQDLDFDMQDGFRAIFGSYLGCHGARLEGSFFWLSDDWTSGANLTTGDYSLGTQLQNNNQNPNAVNIDTTVASVQNLHVIDAVQATRRSDLAGFEFNYIGSLVEGRWHFNPIVGIRGFSLEEDLRMDLTLEAGASGTAAVFESQAENFLIGAQVGGEFGYNVYRCGKTTLDFNLVAKAGFAANIADVTYRIENGDVNNPDAPDDSSTELSPFGEFGIQIELSFGRLIGRIGYQTVVLDNVELGGVPPDLFIFGSDTLQANDTVFYHGLNAGATIAF